MGIPKGIGEQDRYRKEAQEGIKIVQESFKSMEETKNFPEKKMVLDRALREALQAVQDAARGLMNQKLLDEKAQLDKDYSAYTQAPNEENKKRVETDIENMKKTAD